LTQIGFSGSIVLTDGVVAEREVLALPEESPAWLDNVENPDGYDPPWPPEFGVYFERQFECDCGEAWIDLHDCDCNDRCPACDLEIEPSVTRERDALTGAYLSSP
jgi:hypothetical protein